MHTVENKTITARYYPNEYIMIIDFINTIIIKDNIGSNWETIKNNITEETTIQDIQKILSIN
jgi:hypothetical protein